MRAAPIVRVGNGPAANDGAFLHAGCWERLNESGRRGKTPRQLPVLAILHKLSGTGVAVIRQRGSRVKRDASRMRNRHTRDRVASPRHCSDMHVLQRGVPVAWVPSRGTTSTAWASNLSSAEAEHRGQVRWAQARYRRIPPLVDDRERGLSAPTNKHIRLISTSWDDPLDTYRLPRWRNAT